MGFLVGFRSAVSTVLFFFVGLLLSVLLWLCSFFYSLRLLFARQASMLMHTKRNICAIIKRGDISTLEGTPLKLVDTFTYLGSRVESTEKDIEARLTKAWTAINRLSIIWKSDLTDKMKRSFFQAAVASILLYGCTTWTLTKRLEKKLDGNYTIMLRAILNKSWLATPHKSPTVRPPASYHENYSS